MNVILYLRISSQKQSLRNQKDLCLSYIAKHKYLCVKVIEEQCSAYNGIPRKLSQLLCDIENHKYDNVFKLIVYNYDRLSRRVRNIFSILDVLDKKNIKIESVVDNINDYSTPYGEEQLIRRFLAGQTESKLISMRVKDSIISRKHQGTFISGHTPFGYVRDTNDVTRLLENYGEQCVIGFIKFLKNGDVKGIDIKKWLQKLTEIFENQTENSDCMNIDESCSSESLYQTKVLSSTPSRCNLAEIEIQDDITYEGITYREIGLLLNKHGILNRSKLWTTHGIIHIINRKQYNLLSPDNTIECMYKRKLDGDSSGQDELENLRKKTSNSDYSFNENSRKRKNMVCDKERFDLPEQIEKKIIFYKNSAIDSHKKQRVE